METGAVEAGWRLRIAKLGFLVGLEKWVWLELGFWREGNGGYICRETMPLSQGYGSYGIRSSDSKL